MMRATVGRGWGRGVVAVVAAENKGGIGSKRGRGAGGVAAALRAGTAQRGAELPALADGVPGWKP